MIQRTLLPGLLFLLMTALPFTTAFVPLANSLTDDPLHSIVSNDDVHNDEVPPALNDGYRLVVTEEGNTARYLVREQLAGLDFPNDAVGETDAVSGSILFNADGEIVSEESSIVVYISGLTSDRNRRDNFIQRNTLNSSEYPTVQIVPLQTRGLTFPLTEDEPFTFDIVGNLTVRDTTRATSWRVNAQFSEGVLTGTARTEFTFEEFGMEKPRVGSVLSVADAIRLEYDFTLRLESVDSP